MAKKKTAKTSAKIKKVKKTKPVRSASSRNDSSKPAKKQIKSKKPAAKKKITKKTTAVKVVSKNKKKLSFREKRLPEIRKNLLRQKELILAEAEEALNSLPGQTVFPDMSDQATAEIDRNFMLRLRSREQKLLKKIEDALDSIDCGTFGICEACGEAIDIRRLEARPVTTLCIECKTQQEEEEKLREA